MIGILLIGHRNLPETFFNILKDMTNSSVEYIDFVNVFPDDNIDKIRSLIERKIKKLNRGEGVLILTDMFGGTPSNLALTYLKEDEVEVITGINLPMLLKLHFIKEEYSSLKDLTSFIADYGKRNICIATNLLQGNIVE